ncbi:MAG: hypothetical protein P8Y36_00405, partial [Alphaproteobacteria bacterium]
MKILRLEVDFETGRRAGGVNPKSKRTRCHPTWQHLEEGFEFREADDDFADSLRGINGVTVYDNIEDAEAAIAASIPEKVHWKETTPGLLAHSVGIMKPDLSGLSQDATPE